PGAVDAVLDERYAAFLRNNVIMDSPQFIKTFMSQRRTYLLSQLPIADLGISGTNFISISASNLVTISGTAPLLAAAITVNGITFPVTWTTVTNWTVRVPIGVGTNLLTVQISDRFGQSLGSTNVTAVYAGAPPSDGIVFNEIMFNPAVLNAE